MYISTGGAVIGPFAKVETLSDRLRADGQDYQFSMLGDYSLIEDGDHTPTPSRSELKAAREAKVAAIKVTTAAGNTFDGDEISQGRMVRAIMTLQATTLGSIGWVLADNRTIQATASELTEALALATKAQADLWVLP